jgi:hypothetical protein
MRIICLFFSWNRLLVARPEATILQLLSTFKKLTNPLPWILISGRW